MKRGNKKSVQKKILVLWGLIALILLTGCSIIQEEQPEETIFKLETAYNNVDLNEMKSCFDPDLVDLVGGGMDEFGKWSGIDFTMMLNLYSLADSFGILDSEMAETIEISPISLEVLDSAVDGNTAELRVVMEYQGNRINCDVRMIYKNKEWYISSVKEPT